VNNGLSTYRLGDGSSNNTYLSACATIYHYNADSLNGDTVLVDFGTGCTGLDGRVRSGKIQYVYTGGRYYRDSGIVINVTPMGYAVDGYAVSGSKTITNKGRINGNMTWNITANFNIVKPNGGGTIIWNTNRVKTLLNTSVVYSGPANPINWPSARVGITGSAWGNSANGTNFTATVTSQLVRDFSCSPFSGQPHRHPFIQGSVDFTPGTKPVRHIDFGNGACDTQATVTINGNTYAITLH
jgi:hypothetical protein